MAYYTVEVFQDDHENGVPCEKWNVPYQGFDKAGAQKFFEHNKNKIGRGVYIVEIGSDVDGTIEKVGEYPA